MASPVMNDPIDLGGGADKGEQSTHSKAKFKFKGERKSRKGHKRRRPSPNTGGYWYRPVNPAKSTVWTNPNPSSTAGNQPSSPEASNPPSDPSSKAPLDPEVAFRESLFDAMADDEGAQYWEGVYGQPIHTYPKEKVGPTGELEEMTDEEYAAYVRAKMYEKTHQHLMEEKARRIEARRERARLAAEGRKAEREAARFRAKVEQSLKRGEERKKKKMWSENWEAYLSKWDTLGASNTIALASIPWPVESGRRQDVSQREIERFFLYAPTGGDPTESQLSKVLKVERIRWHPDKIQQKLGGQDINEEVMQAVTAVFQIIDRMWSEIRDGNRRD